MKAKLSKDGKYRITAKVEHRLTFLGLILIIAEHERVYEIPLNKKREITKWVAKTLFMYGTNWLDAIEDDMPRLNAIALSNLDHYLKMYGNDFQEIDIKAIKKYLTS